jgi:hypothetical protein
MKKILLVLVAVVATVTASADEKTWHKNFSPVALQKDLKGVHTAVAGDGSVYASSTYNQAFTAGDITVADPEGLTSSCILKFDKDGNAKWVVTLLGKCEISAMTADTDGTLYVAGNSKDEKVVVTGVDGKHYEIVNPVGFDAFYDEVIKANVGFVAMISKDGLVQVIKTIIPELDATIATITGDPYEMGMDFVIYDISGNDPMYVIPTKIMLDGDRVYVAATYTGDVPELGWDGAYLNYGGMDAMIWDVRSKGVFSLNKDDLGDPASVAVVAPTETVQTVSQYAPMGFDFVVYQGVPHVAFFGWGDLTLKTAAGSQPFSFEVGAEDVENALVLANVNAPANAKVFHAAMNAYLAAVYNLVDATIVGENCILGGTFYGNFPLDNSVTKEANTSFVASLKMSDCSVNWTATNEVESYATSMVIIGNDVHASTETANYTFALATGALKDTGDIAYEDMDVCDLYFGGVSIEPEVTADDVVTTPAKVVVTGALAEAAGISTAKAVKTGAAKIYNVNGVELSAPQKGLNIIKTAEGTRKVIK